MTFGDRLKDVRKKAGLTQEELANESGISAGTIQRYELGTRNPKKDTVAKIADALKLGYSYTKDGEPFFYDKSHPSWETRTTEDGVEVTSDNPDRIDDINRQLLLDNFEKLNESGKKEASKRIWELSRLSEYQKDGKELNHDRDKDKNSKTRVRKATQADMDLF